MTQERTFGDYRDRLRAAGRYPAVIERTVKQAGDIILDSWAKPVRKEVGA